MNAVVLVVLATLLVVPTVAWLKGDRSAAAYGFVAIVGLAALSVVGWPRSGPVGSIAVLATIPVASVLLLPLTSAVRLADPDSWWAYHRYDTDTWQRARARHRPDEADQDTHQLSLYLRGRYGAGPRNLP
jgi:hypothetical protein